MKLIVREGHENYAARVVRLGAISPLPNSDRIRTTTICGADVIVGLDEKPGDMGVYFPFECRISPQILSRLNLFSNPAKNEDGKTKGYFGDDGRVKAVRFRGNRSNGFYLPLNRFESGINYFAFTAQVGEDFTDLVVHDSINIPVCEKYTPPNVKSPQVTGASPKGQRQKTLREYLGPEFKFHYKTENLHRNREYLEGRGPIYVSNKFHGTSAIVGNLPIAQDLNFFERLGNWFQKKFKVDLGIETHKHSLVWASRTVVKGIDCAGTSRSSGYYSADVWSEVADTFRDILPPDYTVYGEIIGWAGEKPLQKGYTYGIPKGEWRFVPYRITHKNCEYSPNTIDYCIKEWFDTFNDNKLEEDYWIRLNYYHLYPKIDEENIQAILDTRVNIDCPWNPGMPAEGVVIRLGNAAYKLKNKAFLELESKALDNGEPDEVE